MFIVECICIYILGVNIGSFLNVCIYRIPANQSIVYPPSHCPSCKHTLRAVDLIPILSYLFYRGKCRYCKDKISIQYPFVEGLNGLIYVILFFIFGTGLLFLKMALLCSLLIVVSFIDYRTQGIYDSTIIFGFILGFIYALSSHFKDNMMDGLLGLAIGGGFFLLILFITKGNMGGGDVELMAMLGFCLGWKYIILIILLSFIIGGLVSTGFLLLKIKKRKDQIAFGPFIAVGTLVTICWGNQIINWYCMYL